MKKMTGVMLTGLLTMGLLAGCGADSGKTNSTSGESADGGQTAAAAQDSVPGESGENITDEAFTIAVAIPDYGNAQMLMFKDIYEKQIASDFNCEFIFSEALNNDIASEMQFMENAKNSGADAYITYNISTTEHAENIAAKANDMQMYCAINGSLSENVNSLPYVTGAVDTSVAVDLVAAQFEELTDILLEDGENHNIVICTMGASTGSTQHIQSTAAVLDAVGEQYGFTYTQDTQEIAKAQNVTDVDTGSDIKVCLIPGPQPSVVSDVEQVIKGGEYDVLVCVGPQYSWYESVIKAVEDNLKMDIKTCSIMGIGDSTSTSFHTADATGNPSLNCALLKNASVADKLFVLVYNALTGNPDAYKIDGKAQVYPDTMWVCKDAQTYDLLSQIDADTSMPCFSKEEMTQVLSAVNPSVTAEDFLNFCNSSDAQSIMEKYGLE